MSDNAVEIQVYDSTAAEVPATTNTTTTTDGNARTTDTNTYTDNTRTTDATATAEETANNNKNYSENANANDNTNTNTSTDTLDLPRTQEQKATEDESNIEDAALAVSNTSIVIRTKTDAVITVDYGGGAKKDGGGGAIGPRWDVLMLVYLLSVSSTGCTFGGSYSGEYNRAILFMGFLHFAAEMQLAYYFMYTPRTAMWLARVTWVVMAIQSVVTLFFLPTMAVVFGVEFVISDTLSFMSAICFLLNQALPKHVRYMGFVVSLHFVGVFLKLYLLPIEWWESNITPQHGFAWWLLALANLPQVYFAMDALRGIYNYCESTTYMPVAAQANCCVRNVCNCKRISQVIVPVLAFIVFPILLFVGNAFIRTEKNETGNFFADDNGIWIIVIQTSMWPICAFAFLYTVFVFVQSHGDREPLRESYFEYDLQTGQKNE